MSQPGYIQPQYGQSPYGASGQGGNYNVLAIVSFVSSFFISLAGIICGHIALSQIKRTGERGRGFAIAGLVIGYATLVLGIIFAIVWFAILGAAISTGTITTN